jgi:hypothetical protein
MADDTKPDDPTPAPEPESRPEPKPKPEPAPKPGEPLTAADLNATIKAILKDHGGDQGSAIRAVVAERDKYRDEVATLKDRLPKDGTLVLDADARSAWEAYQALGKPEDLTKALGERDEAVKKATTYERRETHAKIADIHKLKPRVLTTLAERDELDLTVGEVDAKDPKNPSKAIKLEAGLVRGENEKGEETLTPLMEYAAKHWKDDLDWLKAEPSKPAAPTLGSPAPTGQGPPRPKVDASERRRANALS